MSTTMQKVISELKRKKLRLEYVLSRDTLLEIFKDLKRETEFNLTIAPNEENVRRIQFLNEAIASIKQVDDIVNKLGVIK